jgi:CheY-like chemotaxis protein
MKKILIIEDDPFLGDSLERKLSSSGYQTILVKDGALGLGEMRSEHPDLVLPDIILPSMNGYEILEARQQDESLKNIPVIIISNSGQPVEINRALNLGVKDYIVKAQVDPEEVLAKIKTYLPDTAAGENPKQLSGKTVFWAEDDQFLTDVLSAKLRKEGANLLHAPNGDEAMRLLNSNVPDIILLDLVFQGMSGFDILEKISTIPQLAGVPIIALSNLSDPRDLDRTKKLGVAKHLVKAELTPDEIIKEILATIKK